MRRFSTRPLGIRARAPATAVFAVLLLYTLAPAAAEAAVRTGTIAVSPSSGSFQQLDTFQASVFISGNGQPFTSAQAIITVSPQLVVLGLTPGDCPFSYSLTPTAANPSFAATASSGVAACRVYTLTLRANGTGTARIAIAGASIRAGSEEILAATTDAVYQIGTQGPPTAATGTISAYPFSGTYHVGDRFTVGIYLQILEPFFSASGTIMVSPNLVLEAYTPGSCNAISITGNPSLFLTQPGPNTLTFTMGAGEADLNALRGGQCTIAFLTLRVVGSGAGQVAITNAHILVWAGPFVPIGQSPFAERLKSIMNGSYTLLP